MGYALFPSGGLQGLNCANCVFIAGAHGESFLVPVHGDLWLILLDGDVSPVHVHAEVVDSSFTGVG